MTGVLFLTYPCSKDETQNAKNEHCFGHLFVCLATRHFDKGGELDSRLYQEDQQKAGAISSIRTRCAGSSFSSVSKNFGCVIPVPR